ncbi:MAG: RidA family protein [Salinibacterium sp.]|nr:RidA family protein [Salinibacterium sp.]
MTATQIETDLAPKPLSSFSQGVHASGRIVQVSGCGSLNPATAEVIHLGDVAAQVVATLDIVKGILEAGGATFSDVIMLRVYLTDRSDFAAMNAAYEKYIGENVSGVKPCRTTLMVGLPLEGMLVEIDALAVIPD